MSERRVIELDEGWGEMAAGIENLKAILEGDESRKIDRELWINLYTYVFCLQARTPRMLATHLESTNASRPAVQYQNCVQHVHSKGTT